MSVWNVPAPSPEQANILRAVGEALLWPGSSEKWREVFRWCDQHPGHQITRTILNAVADQGGNVTEALEVGSDWEMGKEPRWLTEAFALADGGDVSMGVAMRLEDRRRAAQRRAARKQQEVLG